MGPPHNLSVDPTPRKPLQCDVESRNDDLTKKQRRFKKNGIHGINLKVCQFYHVSPFTYAVSQLVYIGQCC